MQPASDKSVEAVERLISRYADKSGTAPQPDVALLDTVAFGLASMVTDETSALERANDLVNQVRPRVV